MGRKKQTRGPCSFCGQELTRSGMTKHLKTCSQRNAFIKTVTKNSGNEHILYHLLVKDSWDGIYWLHLEMNGSATLSELDAYLRAIWLECCGHMSRFSVGGWKGEEISMDKSVAQVLVPGTKLTHIYDFGTSSMTSIEMVDTRKGKPLTNRPIYLMARNEPPEALCMECNQSASWLCIECLYEYETSGTLCDQHAEDHPHDSYGEPIPLVNSPRIGMCGYTGPADPPY